jgi:hypothetical protein
MAEPHNLTKTLKPFQEILESYEVEYRNTTPAKRDAVIGQIMAEIREAADEKGVGVAEDKSLHKVSKNVMSEQLYTLSNFLWAVANR